MNLNHVEICRGLTSNNFAQSLVAQLDRKGSLSPKQEYWVEKLANESIVAKVPATNAVTGLDRVNDIFDDAALNLKYPKIVIQFADGTDLKLSLAGPKSRYHGAVQLTDGRPFGENQYFGRVENGELILTRDGGARAVELESILRSMSTDLGTFAKMHGQKFGNCCFCRKELTAGPSLNAGYGPICADKYSLPWGEDVAPEAAKVMRPWARSVDAQVAYDEGADITDGASDDEK